jgi:hypothetical protein
MERSRVFFDRSDGKRKKLRGSGGLESRENFGNRRFSRSERKNHLPSILRLSGRSDNRGWNGGCRERFVRNEFRLERKRVRDQFLSDGIMRRIARQRIMERGFVHWTGLERFGMDSKRDGDS